MSDSNSRLVYSTQTGRIEEPKNGAGSSQRGWYRSHSASNQWP